MYRSYWIHILPIARFVGIYKSGNRKLQPRPAADLTLDCLVKRLIKISQCLKEIGSRLLCGCCALLLAVSLSIVRGRASAGEHLFCLRGVDTHLCRMNKDAIIYPCFIRADLDI